MTRIVELIVSVDTKETPPKRVSASVRLQVHDDGTESRAKTALQDFVNATGHGSHTADGFQAGIVAALAGARVACPYDLAISIEQLPSVAVVGVQDQPLPEVLEPQPQ